MELGSFAELASAFFTALAFVAAFFAARSAWQANRQQRVELQEQRATAERDDATKVVTWVRTDDDHLPVVRYINTSTKPVYGLTVWVATPKHTFRVRRTVSGPYPAGRNMRSATEEIRRMAREAGYAPDWRNLLADQELLCAAMFRDTAGRWWFRDVDGELAKASGPDDAVARIEHDLAGRFENRPDRRTSDVNGL